MAKIARIPLSNVYIGGDYTGRILVGPEQQPLNVILDTGSSALALDGTKYHPKLNAGDRSTHLAQTESYGDNSSWTGAVIKTKISIGSGAHRVVLRGGNAAIAYTATANMFGDSDGILGLAYAPLDDAFRMPADTWKNQYTAVQVLGGKQRDIKPYLTQLSDQGVVSDQIAFITKRSYPHVGSGNPLNDPLNQGLMIVGGGKEERDLYTGNFQTVKVLSDEWYCTNLKAIIVGNRDPIVARMKGPKGMPSNSIVDSGTNSLSFAPSMLKAILSRFPAAQRHMLAAAIRQSTPVSVSDLKLAEWPTLKVVMQGLNGEVSLEVPPSNYWQVNTNRKGFAAAAITVGGPGLTILGLPLMNGYYTIFDGEADNGRGVIQFATPRN